MPSILNADEVLKELDACLGVWKDHPEIKLGKPTEKQISLADAQAFRDALYAANKAVEDTERLQTGQRDVRDDNIRDSNDVVKRFRSAVKGLIGPDSAEYEQVGGTRASEIKRSPRKAKAAVAK